MITHRPNHWLILFSAFSWDVYILGYFSSVVRSVWCGDVSGKKLRRGVEKNHMARCESMISEPDKAFQVDIPRLERIIVGPLVISRAEYSRLSNPMNRSTRFIRHSSLGLPNLMLLGFRSSMQTPSKETWGVSLWKWSQQVKRLNECRKVFHPFSSSKSNSM